MVNLFDNPDMAAGYANGRPAVHPCVIERVRKHLGLTSSVDLALDVGCGAGLSTRALQLIARHCIGIDPSEAMIRCGSAIVQDASFLIGSAEALPVLSHSMDIIAAAGSLNFADLDLFFPEAVRSLRPNGVLVIYDFSEGRSFRESSDLDEWYSEFWRRYPPPADFGHEISPESLQSCGFGLRLSSHEYFEIGLSLTPDFYLDYVMTETNVAYAVCCGVPVESIRTWCIESLAPVFCGKPHEVLFRGYLACMVAT